ncbi:acid sensing ion channel 1 [Elysia marginata]|uniref:Acid sensing ion channel 1 n=1 Tax=Elysia marginata TaxID=1093978 RepID=A0AAV4GUX7_9GAST|nr:acid sensing ion channel 1 [Elysia marginata]
MDNRLDTSPVYRRNSFNMADRKSAFGLPETNSDSNSAENFHVGNSNTIRDETSASQKSKGKQQQRSSFWELVKNFGETTSMHGLSHALGDGPIWRRLFWGALVLGFAVWAHYNVIKIIQDYQSRPVLTSVTSEFQNKMPFPAVTFCNINRVRRSKASSSLLDDLKYNAEEGSRDSVSNLLDSALRSTSPDKQAGLGHQLQDMLFGCYFGLEKCNVQNFTYNFNLNQGNCYTFAGIQYEIRKDWTSLKAGPLNGLRLELNAETDEYLPSSTVGGFKVLIHDNKEYPFPEDGGLVVAPGFYTSIGIKKTNIKRLSAPFGSCLDTQANTTKNLFSDEGFGYSRNGCQKSCFQEFVYRNCSCCDSGYPCNGDALAKATGKKIAGGVRWCNSSNFKDVDCMDGAQVLFIENKLGCSDACPPACDQSTFTTSVSTGLFPTQPSFNTTVSRIQKSGKAANISDFNSFLVSSYVVLEIFYDSFILETVSSEPAYTWNKLLGDIGGQLGLLLGFSILTAVEIVELLAVDIGWGLGLASLFKKRNGKAVAHREDDKD